MAETLQVSAGEHVAVLGFGTGYTALILSSLVGSHGQVSVIELDADLCLAATRFLENLGVGNVALHCQNALQLGLPEPVDAVCATLSSWSIPLQWINTTKPGGR